MYVIWSFHFWSMHIYLGIITRTSYSSLSKLLGNEPTTSANPPVLIKGTHPDAAKLRYYSETSKILYVYLEILIKKAAKCF